MGDTQKGNSKEKDVRLSNIVAAKGKIMKIDHTTIKNLYLFVHLLIEI